MEVLRTYALLIGTTRINADAASDAPLKKRPIRDSGACVGYVTCFRCVSVAQAATTIAANTASPEQATGGEYSTASDGSGPYLLI